MSDELWRNDVVQFARLLSEIYAEGVSEELLEKLAERMDLTKSRVESLFYRAEIKFRIFCDINLTPSQVLAMTKLDYEEYSIGADGLLEVYLLPTEEYDTAYVTPEGVVTKFDALDV